VAIAGSTEFAVRQECTPQDLFRFLLRSQHPQTAVAFWVERWELAMLECKVTQDVDQLDARLEGLPVMARWLNQEMDKRAGASDGATFQLLDETRERILLQVLRGNQARLSDEGKDLRASLAKVWDDPEGTLVEKLAEKLRKSPQLTDESLELN